MTGLSQPNTSFMIISSSQLNDIMSVLYAKSYQVIQIKEYYHGIFEDSIITFGKVDNDDLRNDAIFLLNHFSTDSAIIKYLGESIIKKINRDGSEVPMEITMYNTNEQIKSYIHNGISFSFVEGIRYWKPQKKEDFKAGMIIEYFSNSKWYQKMVQDPMEEYEKMYKLLIKYDKIRVATSKDN
jgi:hypothetical protein